MGTDTDWEKWGKSDPYFGVLSADEFRAEKLNEESRAEFFRTGEEHIEHRLSNIRRLFDPDFAPRRSLDFGCGVGRLVVPLAGISEAVVGVDVSDHMLAEAKANCDARNLSNVSFVKSDDGLTGLSGEFDLIHSHIVLQHIAAHRGMHLIKAMLRHLAPGGFIAIQFYYKCDAPKLVRALVKLRYRLPVANAARNLLRGRPLGEPAMQLHTYDLNEVVSLVRDAGASDIQLELSNVAEFQSVILCAQRPA